jgi:hypothetical protein
MATAARYGPRRTTLPDRTRAWAACRCGLGSRDVFNARLWARVTGTVRELRREKEDGEPMN